MHNSTKNNIATAIASVLVIGTAAGASMLGGTNDMRILYESAAPYSYDATEESATLTAEPAVYSEYNEEAADVIYVYVSSSGKYHARADCSGMKSYDKMRLDQAIRAGHSPCRRCYAAASEESVSENIPPSVTVEATEDIEYVSTFENVFPSLTVEAEESIVYVSSSGKYHTKSDCSGMKRSTEMSLDEAVSSGYAACKRCAR